MPTRTLITAAGAAALQAELTELKTVQLPAANRAVLAAFDDQERELATARQRSCQDRITVLETLQANSDISTKTSGNRVDFGAKVEITDCDTNVTSTVQIVSDYEADDRAGKISLNTTLARALAGKSFGDSVLVVTITGTKTYEVQRVWY